MSKLYKTKPKMIFGVCAGLAEATGIDVSIIRLATVLGTIFSGSILLWIYLLLAILLPTKE